jgi:hypothetical protein
MFEYIVLFHMAMSASSSFMTKLSTVVIYCDTIYYLFRTILRQEKTSKYETGKRSQLHHKVVSNSTGRIADTVLSTICVLYFKCYP